MVLSLILGSHPRGMTAQELSRAGEYFGVSPATVRVALTRAVANEELGRQGSTYHLGARLLAREKRQAEHAAEIPWDRTWEMAVVVTAGRPGRERAFLRDTLTAARLGELREGVWMRPANLSRPPTYADTATLRTFRSTPQEDSEALAAGLWDLRAWADETEATLERFETTHEPAPRLAVAAHLVRHLATDPLLPEELWPEWWPTRRARAVYADYQAELREIHQSELIDSDSR